MSSFARGRDIVDLAKLHGWIDSGPGGSHKFLLKKLGKRTVPIRDRLENKFEAQGVLKQLEIDRADWPEKLR